MHELSIMEHVFDIVLEHAQQANAQKVRTVNLSIGALSDILPRWAQLYFDLVSKDSIAENAKLVFNVIPAIIRCRSCGNEFEFDRDHPQYFCSKCHSKYVQLVSGKEFRITNIEVQ